MSQSFIRVKAGAYRTTDVSGQVFQLVEQYKQTAKGGYVTVAHNFIQRDAMKQMQIAIQ